MGTCEQHPNFRPLLDLCGRPQPSRSPVPAAVLTGWVPLGRKMYALLLYALLLGESH